MTEEIELFPTRDLAIKNKKVDDHIILAFDKPLDKNSNAGAKKYGTISLEKKHLFELLIRENYNAYEIIPPDCATKPFWDLEIEKDDFSFDEMSEILDVFIEFLQKEIHTLYGVQIYACDFFIADSCRENKLSYHIVLQNKVYFKNLAEHKVFCLYLIHRLKNPQDEAEEKTFEKMLWLFKNKRGENKQRYILDIAVYGSFQCFRFANQSKLGKKYLLKNITDDLFTDSDGLVRLYFGEGDRKLLKIDDLHLEAEKKETTPRSINSRNKKENTPFLTEEIIYESEGLTIMKDKNMNYEDLHALPEYLQYLFLIPNSSQQFEFYRNVAFAVRGSGGNVDDFKLWARIYLKGEEEKTIEFIFKTDPIINGFNRLRKENCAGIFFLRKYARISHPAFFDNMEFYLGRYFHADLHTFRVIKETSTFMSQENTEFENDILSPEKCLILDAHMGRGKTQAIKRLIKTQDYKRVLFLSPRIAFAKFIAGEFDAACYTDRDLTADKLVISMESLWKLDGMAGYDLIIMDESEANLSVFSSKTMAQKQREIYQVLVDLISRAQKVVFASAFITNKTTNFVRSLQEPVCYIRNMTLPPRREAVEIPEKEYADLLLEAVPHKKIYACWSSITQMDAFNKELKIKYPNIHKEQLNYNGKTDDKIFETLLDIEPNWKKTPLVQCTPCITVGTSYTEKDFDEVWVKAYPTCTVADTMQQSMRVRHLKNKKMCFSLPSKFQLSMNTSKIDIQFSLLKEFDTYSKKRFDILKKLCETWFKDANKYDNKDMMQGVLNMLDNYEETPAPLREILMFNLFETALSKKYYKQKFTRFLEKMNYEVSLLEEEKKKVVMKKEDIKTENTVDEKKEQIYLYDTVPFIDDATAEQYQKNVRKKQATADEKRALERYFFDAKMRDAPIELKQNLFDYWVDNYRKHIINNLFYELRGNVEEDLLNFAYDIQFVGIEQVNTKAVKLSIIQDINARLGLKHSLLRAVIPRAKLEEHLDYIHEKRAEIHEAFNLRDKSPDATKSVKNAVAILDKVYKSWTGEGITMGKREGKKNVVNTFIKTEMPGIEILLV